MTTHFESLTRRRFLRAAAAGGVAYAFGRTPGIAYAQMAGDGAFADYKALVCVFLFGGNDSWNMVVPSSDAEYAVYAASRQNLAIRATSLLPLNLASRTRAAGRSDCIPRCRGSRDCSTRAGRRSSRTSAR